MGKAENPTTIRKLTIMTESISADVPRLLTLPEAADYACVSVGSMRRLVAQRKVRFYKICGLLRFSSVDLDVLVGI